MTIMKPLEVVKSFYEAMSCGDVPMTLGLLDASVEWTEAETFPYYSGTWVGPEAVRKNLIESLSRDWDNFTVEANSFIAEGPIVVAFGIYTGAFKATGKSLASPFAHRWEVTNGRITNFRQYTDTALVRAALT